MIPAILLSGAGTLRAEKITYDDHVRPIFQNRCFTCHNADKFKAGLDLGAYETAIAGSSGGEVLEAGNPDGSLLYLVVTHQEEPSMPPKQDKLSEAELLLVRKWIEGGLLKTAGSTSRTKKKPAFDMALEQAPTGNPKVLPTMPQHLLLEPPVVARRGGALAALASNPWIPLLALSGQKQVLLYDGATLDLAGILPFPEGQVESLAFSRNGRLLLAAGGRGAVSGRVVVWNVAEGRRLIEVGGQLDAVLTADLRSDQTQIALGGPEKLLKVYGTDSGELLYSIKKHTDWIMAVAYSPDGVLLASGDRNGGLVVWEAHGGGEFYALGGHGAAVTSLSWRDDSNVLASAGEDGFIRLWEMFHGKQVKNWKAHDGGVTSVWFGHDGRLVSSGRDKHVRIWKQDGKQERAFEPFEDIALRAVFTHDGQHVVAGDWQGQIRVWHAEDGALAGSLSSNPPTLAQRLAEATKVIAALETKTNRADQALSRSTAEAVGPRAALADARRDADDAVHRFETASDAAEKSKQALDAASKARDEALKQIDAGKTDAEKAVGEARAATESHTQAVAQHQKAQERVASMVKLAARLAEAAADAMAAHEKDSQYEPLAEASANASRAAESAAQARVAAQQAEVEKTEESKRLEGQMTDARRRAEAADSAVEQATRNLAEREVVVKSAAEKFVSSENLMQNARSAKEAPQQRVTELVEPARQAEAKVAEAERAHQEAGRALGQARTEAAKWSAAQINVKVIAARQHVEHLQARHDGLALATDQIRSNHDKAVAALAATEQAMARGPQTIREKQEALQQAKQTALEGKARLESAEATVLEKRSLIDQVAGMSARVSEGSAGEPDNEKLARAAVRADESLELLREDLKAAEGVVADRMKALEAAGQAADAAVKALDATHADIARLNEEVTTRRAGLVAARADLDKAAAAQQQAADAVGDARSRFEELQAAYFSALPDAPKPQEGSGFGVEGSESDPEP